VIHGARLISLADFDDPELASALREVAAFEDGLPDEVERPLPLDGFAWSAGVALQAARAVLLNAPASRVLVLGDGFGSVPFILAQAGHQVHWCNTFTVRAHSTLSSLEGLLNATLVLPGFSAREHMSIQHADPRVLPYPGDAFDLVLAAGWLERLEDEVSVEQAAYEIGRVAAPGAEVVLGLPLEVVGPPAEMTHHGVRFRDADGIRSLLLSSSGLTGGVSNRDLVLDNAVAERRSDLLGILATPVDHDWGVRLDSAGADLVRSSRGFTTAPVVLRLTAGGSVDGQPPLADAADHTREADRERLLDVLRNARLPAVAASREVEAAPVEEPSAALQMRRALTVTQEAARFHRRSSGGLRRLAFTAVDAVASVGLRTLDGAELYGTRLMK
jgi:SAM-dependent methyltransferase